MELIIDSAVKKQYETILFQHNLELKSFLHSSGISFSQISSAESLTDFLLKSLPLVGILQ